ncbi:MAG: glycine/betaine ABC transporter substrate-binding protein, partial [Cytophagales bacterium]|nr:glycine/betaine ABC transporter substrate-binding protein [Armatimonadota bacterium]
MTNRTFRTFRFCLVFAAFAVLCGLGFTGFSGAARAADPVVVGSKKFTESYVLGEIAKKTLADAGFAPEHRQGIGATGIVWEALRTGSISAYPEYTGTITEEILKTGGKRTPDQTRELLKPFGVGMTGDLGFDDTYALVMRRDQSEKLGIRTISDLRKHPDLRVSLSNEFLERKDGWRPLQAAYRLSYPARGIEHGLAYAALSARQIDLTDAYSTDAGIARYDLVVLRDDRQFFPQYRAVFLYRLDLPPGALAALKTLEGTIDEAEMTRLNAEAEKTKDYAIAAASYFGGAARAKAASQSESYPAKLTRWTLRHLTLVGVSLLGAVLVGIPLGIVASRGGLGGQSILGTVGVIQTIPSLALLAFLVPVLGITPASAIVALFLYSLLPIVRNTATGLQD